MKRLQDYLEKIEPVQKSVAEEVQRRLDLQTKPQGSLGALETLCTQLAAAQWTTEPRCEKKVIFTMAADHGVAEEGVSAYPQSVTAQMVLNFLRGGAAVNVLARHAGCSVFVVDMGVKADLRPSDASPPDLGPVDLGPGSSTCVFVNRKVAPGTANFTKSRAMSREQAERAVLSGIELALESDFDILGTGDMGIANTTSSSAIGSVLTGLDPADITGRGTGVDDAGLAKKIGAIRRGIAFNKPDAGDPLDVLSKVGGFEIGGIAGLLIGCAVKKRLAVVDGFISTAGAMIAVGLSSRLRDYFVLSHRSFEKGHDVFMSHLGKKPLLDLGMRLGEGTGSALAIEVIDAAVRLYREMATFDQAGVDKKRAP